MKDLSDFLRMRLRPGICALVGAGGKSTFMRTAGAQCARAGVRVRLTTTTRVGVEEFAGFPVRLAADRGDLDSALRDAEPVVLVAGSVLPGGEKYGGLDRALIDEAELPADVILLVEADGSRRRPVKAPTPREPVIPARARSVLAFLGAAGFDEAIDEEHCYNHEGALSLLGKTQGRLDAESIATLAAHPGGLRKGVLPSMDFHVVVNQGDLENKRATATAALRILSAVHGIGGNLVSLRAEALYETS